MRKHAETNMTKEFKMLLAFLGVVLVVSIITLSVLLADNGSGDQVKFTGAAGNLLAENYDPYVQYNGGYNSAKPIKTSDSLDGGATTVTTLDASGAVVLSSTLQAGASTLSSLTVSGASDVVGLTQGGSTLASSTTNTAETLPATYLTSYTGLVLTPNTADTTYTFPASSTLTAMIPNTGDFITKTISNATSTAGIDVVIAAGAGMSLSGTSSPKITPQSAGFLTFIRESNSDISVHIGN